MNLKEFHSYYQNLYKDKQALTQQDFDEFISQLPIPSLSEEHKSILEREVTIGRVLLAFKQVSPAKALMSLQPYTTKNCPAVSSHLVNYFNTLQKGDPEDVDLIGPILASF